MEKPIRKERLKQAVRQALIRSCTEVPPDVLDALIEARKRETNPRGQRNLDLLILNAQTAAKTHGVICQDTGVPTFFIKTSFGFPYGGSLREAFDEAVREVTAEFPLRSMICDPITRYDRVDNTGENVPLIHVEIEPDLDYMEIRSCPKGAGSGVWSQVRFFAPTDGMEAVREFIIDSVRRAGSNPCPPTIVGVGLGGPLEEVARLATKASFRPLDQPNPDPAVAALERELKDALNGLGIGPMGMGGDTTVLAVNIERSGTHKPWLPVAVNLNCWPGRRAAVRLYADGRIEDC